MTNDEKDTMEHKLIMGLEKSDLEMLHTIMAKWSFKDFRSLFSFSLHLLRLHEDPFFMIRIDGDLKPVSPFKDLNNLNEFFDKLLDSKKNSTLH